MKAFEQPLSELEEKEMIKRSQSGDMDARNILVEKNMRLVAHMIKKYMSPDRDTDDLISVGTIGLIKAVNTFDPDKKIRLATYAAKCIDNELLMMLRNDRKKLMELSLSEPIGTDKEGNDITFMDVVGDEERDDAANMWTAFHILSLIVSYSPDCNLYILSIRLHNFYLLTNRELVALFYII